jgi:hypothetical protein
VSEEENAVKALLMAYVFKYEPVPCRQEGFAVGFPCEQLFCRYENRETGEVIEHYMSEETYFALLEKYGLRQIHDDLHSVASKPGGEGDDGE